MTRKTIVRYTPPNPIIGARELSPNDFKGAGVFTQKKPLVWRKERGFWLDVDEDKISPEALAWLENPDNHQHKGEFSVERQEIEDEEGSTTTESAPKDGPVEGEQPAGAGTPGTTTGTTTQSTARR